MTDTPPSSEITAESDRRFSATTKILSYTLIPSTVLFTSLEALEVCEKSVPSAANHAVLYNLANIGLTMAATAGTCLASKKPLTEKGRLTAQANRIWAFIASAHMMLAGGIYGHFMKETYHQPQKATETKRPLNDSTDNVFPQGTQLPAKTVHLKKRPHHRPPSCCRP